MQERNSDWLPLIRALTGTKPTTQACAHDLSLCRTTPNQLNHTGQGSIPDFSLTWPLSGGSTYDVNRQNFWKFCGVNWTQWGYPPPMPEFWLPTLASLVWIFSFKCSAVVSSSPAGPRVCVRVHSHVRSNHCLTVASGGRRNKCRCSRYCHCPDHVKLWSLYFKLKRQRLRVVS